MLKFKKIFNTKIILLMMGISFLFINTPPYAYPDSKDTLRVPVGEDSTRRRITNAIHETEIDMPLEKAAGEEGKPRLQSIELSEFGEGTKFAAMISLFVDVDLDNLARALETLCRRGQIQRFRPEGNEWIMQDRDKPEVEIAGHASDKYGITISDRLEGGSAEEAEVLGQELLKYFNVIDDTDQHLSPEFGRVLLAALTDNNPDSEPFKQFVTKHQERLGNLDINDRDPNLLRTAAFSKIRHYTARRKTIAQRAREKKLHYQDVQAMRERRRQLLRGGPLSFEELRELRKIRQTLLELMGSPQAVLDLKEVSDGEAYSTQQLADKLGVTRGTIAQDVTFLLSAGVFVPTGKRGEVRLAPELQKEEELLDTVRAIVRKEFDPLSSVWEDEKKETRVRDEILAEIFKDDTAWEKRAESALETRDASYKLNGRRITAPAGRALSKALHDLGWLKPVFGVTVGEYGRIYYNFDIEKERIKVVAFEGSEVLKKGVDKFIEDDFNSLSPNQQAAIVATDDDMWDKLRKNDELQPMLEDGRIFIVRLEENSYAVKQWSALIGDEKTYNFKSMSVTEMVNNIDLLQALATAK